MDARDPRDYQIVFLSSFGTLGSLTGTLSFPIAFIPVVFLACSGTQIFLARIEKFVKSIDETDLPFYTNHTGKIEPCQFPSLTPLKSALITALGLCLLLRGNHYQTMALAGVLAIASKFVFRVRGKHFFNPGNFGIVAVLAFTGDAWVSPGQWGTDRVYLLLFTATAGMILRRVGRWETSGTFLLVYGGLEMFRDYRLGWTADVWLHQLSNGSLLLFAFFMITDPRSLPNSAPARVLWATALAGLTFYLQHAFYLATAPFWALFILSPTTVLLDRVWSARRFSWWERERSVDFGL